ncbi:MAG: aminoacyl-tRNA hydrolase [Actinomycetota bacterium]
MNSDLTWLVCGLGNPGDRYARTRHNLGAMTVAELASRAGERLKKVRFVNVHAADFTEGPHRVIVATADAYMNESGPSYASLARKRDIEPANVIAVHDELDLAFGALKVKVGGSTAGHNGLRSLEGALRTPEFHRVRVGIGRPPGRQDPGDFVLRPFSKDEAEHVPALVDDAADAVLSLVRDGLAAAQDRFNRGALPD